MLNVAVLHECFPSLHALLQCWHAASLSRHKVNHKESLALAAKYLNYECSETCVELVYKKLRNLKKEFAYGVGGTGKNNQ